MMKRIKQQLHHNVHGDKLLNLHCISHYICLISQSSEENKDPLYEMKRFAHACQK